jgi:hypothetical protein
MVVVAVGAVVRVDVAGVAAEVVVRGTLVVVERVARVLDVVTTDSLSRRVSANRRPPKLKRAAKPPPMMTGVFDGFGDPGPGWAGAGSQPERDWYSGGGGGGAGTQVGGTAAPCAGYGGGGGAPCGCAGRGFSLMNVEYEERLGQKH